MKKNIVSFSVNHPISVLMVILAIILLGVISVFNIKVDFLPSLQERNILITTEFEGISCDEMQKLITIPVEDSFTSLKGIKNINSVTRDGISLVNIELHWGTDIDLALSESREIIDSCYITLPSGCEKPIAKIYNPLQADTISFAVIPKDNDLSYCRYLIDNEIKQRIQRIKGVGSVTVTGGEKEEIQILLHKSEVESKKLTLDTISNILASSNFEYPAGTIREGNKEILLKTSGLYSNINQILDTPLAYNEGGVLRISDIGTVKKTSKEKDSFFIYNGCEAISIEIKKNATTSPIVLSKNIKNEIKNLQNLYGKNYDFLITNDASIQIKSSIFQLLLSALIGIIITFAILFFFFRTLRTSLVVASLIPLSMITSFISLYVFNKSLNLLSLAGITVGIGMVIDNSTVVVENIQRWISEKKSNSFVNNIIGATTEVILSSLGSSLTTIVVFIPFFFLDGLLGEIFSDMAIAIISSILFSCILSITYIPAIVFLLYKNNINHLQKLRKISTLEKVYSKSLIFCFKHKFLSFLSLILCTIIGFVLCTFIKKELLPATTSSIINVEIYFPSGTSISKLYEHSLLLNNELNKINDINQVFINGGIDDSAKDILVNPSIQKERLYLTIFTNNQDLTQHQIEKFLSTTKLNYNIQGKQDILSNLLAIRKDSYLITADSENDVLTKSKELTNFDYQIIPYNYVTQQIFSPDRQMCSRFNITTMYTAQVVHNSLEGIESCYFYEEGRRIPIKIKYKKDEISNLNQLENINVLLEDSYVPIRILGSFHEEKTEKILYRANRKNAKILQGVINFNNAEIPSLMDIQIKELIGNASFLLIIIMLLLYCLMGAEFQSFILPLMIMTALPPSFCGAFIALFICNQSININSVIALVILFGTSVNNSIIIYEVCKEVKNTKSIISACCSKLRVIIITTITTIFALIPFAIDPFNKSSQTSMSIAIIGGLFLSTLIVLLIVPIIMESYFRNKKHD